jgi:uronate dehydrogenase
MQIAITGASGNVGRTVAAALEGRHTLALMDEKPLPGRDILHVDLSDFADVLDRMPEADAVIHLGANPNEAPWQ